MGHRLVPPVCLVEHLVIRNLVRARRARGEFAKQICALIACNLCLVQNPVRELLILILFFIFLLISLWFCDIMAMRHSLIFSCPKSMLVKT